MENYQKKAEQKNLVELQKQKRASKQDEKKIGNIMGSDCNYSMSSSFSYKLFLSWKSRNIYWLGDF